MLHRGFANGQRNRPSTAGTYFTPPAVRPPAIHHPKEEDFSMKTVSMLLVLVAFALVAAASALADTWGDQINGPSRFLLLPGYGGRAVLDQETGLVWEQSPGTTLQKWPNSQFSCTQKTVGNR